MNNRIPIYNHLPSIEECYILHYDNQEGLAINAPDVFLNSMLLYGVTIPELRGLLRNVKRYVEEAYPVYDPYGFIDVSIKDIVLCDSIHTAELVNLYIKALSEDDIEELSLLRLEIELDIMPENPWTDVCTLSMNQFLTYLAKTQRLSAASLGHLIWEGFL